MTQLEKLAEREFPVDNVGWLGDSNQSQRLAFIKGLKIGQQLAQWCGAEAMMNMDIEEITTIFLTEKYESDEEK